jgi:hypothetical protein
MNTTEEFTLSAEDIVKKIKEIIDEGNARKIIIKNEKGVAVMEIPLVIGTVGVLIAPVLAAAGTIAALLTKCTIVVVKRDQ